MSEARRSVSRRARLPLVVLGLAALCAAADLPAQPVPSTGSAAPGLTDEERVRQLVASASAHAGDFASKASALLAREHYVQEVKTRPSSSSLAPMTDAGITVLRRRLDSEVALVLFPGELWLLARDILVVDGHAVPDNERIRLPAVHPASDEEALRTFRALAQQGARYNIGGIRRNLNVPTLGLWLLTPSVVERFRFKRAGNETIGGERCEVLAYEEIREPYLFLAEGRSAPVHGRAWVKADSGAIIRTELVLEGRSESDRLVLPGGRGIVTVDYRLDPAFDTWVPQTMRERYDAPESSDVIVGTATYSDYRRFEVHSRIVPRPQ